MDGEVPQEIVAQLIILENSLKDNKKLSVEYKSQCAASKCDDLHGQVDGIVKIASKLKNLISIERVKSNGLIDKLSSDQVVAHRIMKINDVLRKNPEYGRSQTIDYMHQVVSENEKVIIDHKKTTDKLRSIISDLQNFLNDDNSHISGKSLIEHIQRFDQIFSSVASQVYDIDSEVERLKEAYMAQRQRIYGRFTADPFAALKQKQKKIDEYSELKGLDPFPSYSTISSLTEFLPKQAAQQQPFGAAPTFGSNSMFAPKSSLQMPSAFSFTQPSSSAPLGSLFGPKTNTPSLFSSLATSSTATTSPFLSNTSMAPLGIGASTNAGSSFSNTLSSATSGTLFKGSASIFGK